jgi:hypothetical protein
MLYRLLAAVCLVACLSAEETVDIKPLTDTQIAALKAAKEKLDAAKAEYAKTEEAIKNAHGVMTPSGFQFADCLDRSTSAELLQRWIVVRYSVTHICGPHIRTTAK